MHLKSPPFRPLLDPFLFTWLKVVNNVHIYDTNLLKSDFAKLMYLLWSESSERRDFNLGRLWTTFDLEIKIPMIAYIPFTPHCFPRTHFVPIGHGCGSCLSHAK